MGLNKAMIIGNLGGDPEVRYTQSGAAVANFSIATNETWVDKAGKKQERTEWHRIVVFGKLAESCGKYLAKGRSVYVEGRIQTRNWEGKDGKQNYTTEIIASTVEFLSDGGRSGGGGQSSAGSSPEPGPSFDQSFNDDDLPF